MGCLKYELGLLTREPRNTFKWQYELFPAPQSTLEYPLANLAGWRCVELGGIALLPLQSPVHCVLCHCVPATGEALRVLRELLRFPS